MTYRLAIYTDPAGREPARVAILSPGARPDEVEGVDEGTWRWQLARLLDLGTDERPGVACDELLIAPSVHAKQMAEAYEAWVGPLPSPEDAPYAPDALREEGRDAAREEHDQDGAESLLDFLGREDAGRTG